MSVSNTKNLTPLKHSEVQKQILAKTQNLRSSLELFDESGKYRDQNVADYQAKKREFLEVCKQYNRLNRETLTSTKKRLNSDYEDLLDLSFLNEKAVGETEGKDECSSMCCCEKCEPNLKGNLHRRRTTRPIHSKEEERSDSCVLEPWFKRHLILNKFIWAARTTILKLRLLKVLDKLKTLTPQKVLQIENERDVLKICELHHCDPVFAKFL